MNTSLVIRFTCGFLSLACSSIATAAQYSFVRIDSPGTLTAVYAGNVNNHGEVSFTGFHTGNASGIYKGSGGAVTTIAQTGSTFSFFNAPSINCHGEVGFRGLGNSFSNGAFKGSGGPLTTIHTASNGVDFGGIDDDGTVVVYNNSLGIMTGNGGPLTTIASVGSQFTALGNLPQIHGREVVFAATLPNGDKTAWSSYNGTLTQFAVSGGSVGDVQYPHNRWDNKIWYSNLTNGESEIRTRINGVTTTFVDTTGPYNHFGFNNSYDINYYNEVAFSAARDSMFGVGIYTGPNAVTDSVIGPGDTLAGKTVRDAYFGGLNDRGQISFGVMFSDFTYGMFRADPAVLNPNPGCNIPEPGSLGCLCVGILALARRRTDI